jgi:large subunit ribosomal protein L5
MEVPRLEKVVLNIGAGEAIQNAKALEAAEGDLTTIAGQHPITTRSKKSISAFKLRVGMPIGLKVTLRGKRMYDFLDRLINAVLPRVREFQGVPRNSFDGRGNYTLGMKEQIIFPEIEYDKIDKVRGLEISIVTTAKTDEEGRQLLELLGLPFSRDEGG